MPNLLWDAVRNPVADAQVNFWPMSAGEIDFDVGLRELQGQEGADVRCGLPGTIGHRLGRPVLMTGGGGRGKSLLGFDARADRVVLPADPLGVQLTAAAGRDS
ncbi:hypothetical protein [Streptomyces sp. NPDC090036]|uniref:hypothetical protein n=1 Tax=Streptomyces sp. NPDC090036 TaxID=3365926 RepID=UPI0037FF38F2